MALKVTVQTAINSQRYDQVTLASMKPKISVLLGV